MNISYYGPELIVNGGVENGSGDPWIPTGWANYASEAGELIQSLSEKHSGFSSLNIDNDGGAEGVNSNYFSLVANYVYQLSLWAKGVLNEPRIVFKDGDGGSNLLFRYLNLGNYTDWRQFQGNFTATVSGSSGRIRIRSVALPINWYIDDVSVKHLISVDLPNPIFGDSLKFSNQGIKRVMPFGQLKVFKDSDWPVLETFTYDIYRLTETQKDDFINLLNFSTGLELTITDHNGAIRTGFIVTPTNEILTIQDECWYDVHFEFMANSIVDTLGDCHPLATPQDSDIPTIDDPLYGRIYAEDGTLMYAEDNDDLWIEGI
jgi:hypothetical protein